MRFAKTITTVVTLTMLAFTTSENSWAAEMHMLPEDTQVTTESIPENPDPNLEVPTENNPEQDPQIEPDTNPESTPVPPAEPESGEQLTLEEYLSPEVEVTHEIESIDDPAEVEQLEAELAQEIEESPGPDVRPLPDCDRNNRFRACSVFRVKQIGSCPKQCPGERPVSWEREIIFRFDHYMESNRKTTITRGYAYISESKGKPPNAFEEIAFQLIHPDGHELFNLRTLKISELIGPIGFVTISEDILNIPQTLNGDPAKEIHFRFDSNMDHVSMVNTSSPVKVRCGQAWNRATRNCVNPDIAASYVVSLTDHPEVAAHIDYAINSRGKPSTLTKNTPGDDGNRNVACSPMNQRRLEQIEPPPDNMDSPSCDEYPFNSALEGGAGASIRWVSEDGNQKQGFHLGQFYRNQQVQQGDKYTVSVEP